MSVVLLFSLLVEIASFCRNIWRKLAQWAHVRLRNRSICLPDPLALSDYKTCKCL